MKYPQLVSFVIALSYSAMKQAFGAIDESNRLLYLWEINNDPERYLKHIEDHDLPEIYTGVTGVLIDNYSTDFQKNMLQDIKTSENETLQLLGKELKDKLNLALSKILLTKESTLEDFRNTYLSLFPCQDFEKLFIEKITESFIEEYQKLKMIHPKTALHTLFSSSDFRNNTIRNISELPVIKISEVKDFIDLEKLSYEISSIYNEILGNDVA